MSIQGKLAKDGISALKILGKTRSAALAGTSADILVLLEDNSGKILLASGTDVPAGATSGYAKGCLFIDRNVATGSTGLYENIGINTSCNFNAIGAITEGEIALANTKLLIGSAAGVAAAFALSGDATMTAGGVVTITKSTGDFQIAGGDLDAGSSGAAGSVDVFPTTTSRGKLAITCTNQTGDTTVSLVAAAMAAARTITLRDPGAAASILTTTDATAAATAATAAEITGACDLSAQVMTPGAGITAGVGTVFKTSVVRQGDIIKTIIILDLTGLASSTTADDIIGTAGVCHLGRITAALNGTLFFGQITCLETPAGGDLDIDFWSADEETGAFDALVTALTEVIMRANGGNWGAAAATQIAFTNLPAANKYMYMAVGSAGGTPGTYTAGQFLIELWGV